MLVTYLPQALQIPFGRDVPTRAAGHRLDNDGRHIAGVVQRQDALLEFVEQVVGELGQLAFDVGMLLWVMDESHVVHAGQHGRTKSLAVAADAAHAHAAKTHTVVAALAANEHRALSLAAGAVISQGHLQ